MNKLEIKAIAEKITKKSMKKYEVKEVESSREFNNLTDLSCNLHLIPEAVAVDVMKRIADWLSSGGSSEDRYIKTQLEYASKFI